MKIVSVEMKHYPFYRIVFFGQKLCVVALLLSILVSSNSLEAQDLHPKLVSQLEQSLDSMTNRLNVYGLAASVVVGDQGLWRGGSGVSTFDPVDSISGQHYFATGSSTKTVTSACILQMVDEGKLSLDDLISQWIPSIPYINPNITVRQLLSHQSGIYDVLQNDWFQPVLLQNPNKIWDLETVVRMFIRREVFPAGSSWQYSNTNFLLLGMIIESISGQSYHDEVKERFFEPYGLTSFANLAYDALPQPVAHLWLDLNGDGRLEDAHQFITGWKSFFSATGPAGGYFAQPSDLAKWMRLCMSGDLFSDETFMEATTFVNTSMPGGTQYGLGLMTRAHLGLQGLGHGGDISYSTNAMYFPEKDVSISVQCHDSRINSWFLYNVVSALLKTYLDCESVVSTNALQGYEFSVFPNPISEIMSIQLDEKALQKNLQLEMYTTEGSLVWQQKYDRTQNLKFSISIPSSVRSGQYHLLMKADGQRLGGKTILVRR